MADESNMNPLARPPALPRSHWSTERWLLALVLLIQLGLVVWFIAERRQQQRQDYWAQRMELERAQAERLLAAADPFGSAGNNLPALAHHMLSERVDPFQQMQQLMNMDEGWDAMSQSPTLDMRENDRNYELVFSLPEPGGTNVSVTLEGRLLTVSLAQQKTGGNGQQFHQFASRVLIPGPIGNPDKVQAQLTNGVLRIFVPKAESVPLSNKPVKIL